MKIFIVSFIIGSLAAVAPAAAQRADAFEGRGIAVSIGGGFGGFTDDAVLDVAQDVGGQWSAGVLLGTNTTLGLEASYQGAAYTVDVIGTRDEANLVATGIDGALRFNFTTDAAVQPYVLAGLGFKHYELMNEDAVTASAVQDDGVLEIPIGAGVAYRFEPLQLDARVVLRPAFGSELVVADDDATLTNWVARVGLGWEF